jgi:hypothetical protein
MATLPSYVKILYEGYIQQKESAVLRTDFETGPPRQARVKSRTMKTRTAKLFIDSKENFLLFETWFADDLQQGALFFTMADPVSGSNIEARFVGGIYSAQPMTPALNLWQLECQIESWGL